MSKWYILHTSSGSEKRVKKMIEAQIAKKGEFSGTCSFAGKVLGMHMQGKAPSFILAEFFGACQNDAGSGIWHMNSFKCHFSIEVVQMPKTQNEGYCKARDADGDTVHEKQVEVR